ncbi:ATP-binding protein [Paenibacillus sp. CAU 1782]
MKAIGLQIPAHADYIDVARSCLYGVAVKLGFSFEDIEDMKVALSEACNNAVLHGSGDDDGPVIDISFQPGDGVLAISVINRGPSFPYEAARHDSLPLQGGNSSELRVGGLGIFLMEALMDEVNVLSQEGCTEVRLIKYKS